MKSKVRKCWEGRRVVLFKERPGPDRELGATRSGPPQTAWGRHAFSWKVFAPEGGRVYAKATPKVGDGFVCRGDRSRTIVNGVV